MITGPRITERSMIAPASIDDFAFDARLGVDRARRCAARCVSRISRFASSMSSSLPVSFHQPSTMCGRTSRPRSIRSWMASVISSSLRKLGLIALDRLEDRRREHVDADQREVALRLLRLLDQPDHAAVLPARRRRTSADPARASAGSARPGASRTNSSTNCVMPLFSRLSPRYITNGSLPMNGSLIRTACARPRGASCSM